MLDFPMHSSVNFNCFSKIKSIHAMKRTGLEYLIKICQLVYYSILYFDTRDRKIFHLKKVKFYIGVQIFCSWYGWPKIIIKISYCLQYFDFIS